jgi:hypothetical protein
MRLRVAYYIAQALDHCNAENRKIYHDLNAYRILFDEVCSRLLAALGLKTTTCFSATFCVVVALLLSKVYFVKVAKHCLRKFSPSPYKVSISH